MRTVRRAWRDAAERSNPYIVPGKTVESVIDGYRDAGDAAVLVVLEHLRDVLTGSDGVTESYEDALAQINAMLEECQEV